MKKSPHVAKSMSPRVATSTSVDQMGLPDLHERKERADRAFGQLGAGQVA
jgi:hypothetical protein